MNQEELKELINFLSQKDISEFSIERADLAVKIKRRVEVQGGSGASLLSTLLSSHTTGDSGTEALAADQNTSVLTTAADPEPERQVLKSPMVGIFHSSRSADGRPFLCKGDIVEVGQVVGMVEMLRLMHEVHSDVAGKVLEIMTGDREPVEYGQALLAVQPEKMAS